MKKTIKISVILFMTIFLANFSSFALNIKTLNNEINIDVIKKSNNILVLKSEIVNETYENETYIRNYKNILIKYTDNKEVFKLNLSPKSIKSNKKSIYEMPKSLIYIDNEFYYVLENTDNNFFSVTKISKNGKIEYTKSFSGTATNIKSINDSELIIIGGSPAFILKINKNSGEEIQKLVEEYSSIFNDFLQNKDAFLMVGENFITKESLMIKYDLSLNKVVTMSLGYKEFSKILALKENSYFLLGENNQGGILTQYSNKERILFQKDKDKNLIGKVINVNEKNKEIIIFTYLKEKRSLEISKYKNFTLIAKKYISSDIEPYVLKENDEFYISTNNKLYKMNNNLKTSYLNIKNIKKIIKLIINQNSITIVSEKSIDNYNKLFIIENIINYILILILIVLLAVIFIYYNRISNIKFFKKAKIKSNKIHTKLHNQTREKSKTKNKKSSNKKHKKKKKK